VEALTLSKPVLMSRKSVETLSLGLWRALISWVRERQALSKLRPGRGLHWVGWSKPSEQAIADNLTTRICSRIFDTVLRRTIMKKEARES